MRKIFFVIISVLFVILIPFCCSAEQESDANDEYIINIGQDEPCANNSDEMSASEPEDSALAGNGTEAPESTNKISVDLLFEAEDGTSYNFV